MGLEEFNITDGEKYANLLTEEIWLSHRKHGSGTEAEAEVIEYWCEGIKEACIKRYAEYIAGDEEDYRLGDGEMMELYRKAVDRVTSEAIEALLEKGDIRMGVSETGEILYSTTEQGRKKLKENTKPNVKRRKKNS